MLSGILAIVKLKERQMLAALLIVVSRATSLVEGVLIKKYNSKHDKGGFIFTALVSLFSMLFFLITDKGGLDFRPEMLPYGIASGVFYCSASLLTFIALGCGPFTLSMLILSYSGVFSIVYGIFFLKDPVTVFTVMGIILILVSLFLNRAEKKNDDKKASFKWLICIGLSVLGSGMFAVIQKMQQVRFENAVTNEYMIVTLGFSFIILFAVGLVRDGKDALYILRYGGLYASVAGLSNGATNFLGLAVNMLLPLSVVSPVGAGVKIIMSFMLSLIVFKEKFLKRQVAAVIIGTAALVLLNFKI